MAQMLADGLSDRRPWVRRIFSRIGVRALATMACAGAAGPRMLAAGAGGNGIGAEREENYES